jgi:hypothetical protein
LKLKLSKINIVIASIYLIVFFAFTAGIINALIEGQKYNVSQFLPSRSIQNNYETIIGISILISGLVGTMMMYKANSINKREEKYILLIIGLVIFSGAVYFMYYLVSLKQG